MGANIRTTWNETMVIVNQSQELTKLTLSSWLWKVSDDLDLLFQGCYALAVHLMSEEFKLINSKDTLSWIDNHTMLVELF